MKILCLNVRSGGGQAPGQFVDRRNALGGRLEFRAHNRPRDRDRIGERLGADERRPDVKDAGGMLAVDALARAVRFERAFIKQDRPAGAVRQDERDCVSGAPPNCLAGQEFAVRVEQDGGRFFFVDIDPDVNAILARPVFDVESAAAHAQGRVRADDKDGAALARGLSAEPEVALDERRGQPPLVLARLSFCANVARAHGRAADVAYRR